MAREHFSSVSEEFLRDKQERQIREATELYGWSVALAADNPVDILILLETMDEDDYIFESKGNKS